MNYVDFNVSDRAQAHKTMINAPLTAKARQLASVRGRVNVGTKTKKKPNKFGALMGFRVTKGAGRGR